MRYFVVAPDGSKFGPADIPTLRAWVLEGRIAPDTILEEEASRQRVAARFVAGLTFPEMPSYAPPMIPQRGQKAEYASRGDDGSMDVLWSYLCSAMTIICCCLFNFAAFAYASKAIAKGNPRGRGARIFAFIMLVVWIITTILTIPFIGQLLKLFHDMTGT